MPRKQSALVLSFLMLVVAVAAASDKRKSQRGPATFQEYRSGLALVGYGMMAGNVMRTAWLGSGFFVDDNCTVVTAKHILHDVPRDSLILRVQNPARPGSTLTLSANVLHEVADRDLVFMRISETAPGVACSSRELGFFALPDALERETLIGQAVQVAGFPMLEGEQPRDVAILRRGGIASAELEWEGQPMLLLDLTGVPGFSGAPVIHQATGEAIGVIFGPGRTERQYDLEWATPITRADYKQALAAARRGS